MKMKEIKNLNFTYVLLLFLTLMIGDFKLSGQAGIAISGHVTGKDSWPIPGVNVKIKGTLNGTITNLDGIYEIMITHPNDTLVFSFIGMKTIEEKVGGRTIIDVQLEEDFVDLDEIVVVGYGEKKKSDLVGSVSSVSKEKISNPANTNLYETLQASTSGLLITRNSGQPGSDDYNILIRGMNSISASNEPLIVVDGIPFTGSLSDISPADIQSVEILKDASSSAIYGSRGSNGILLLTTKRGIADKPLIELRLSSSLSQIAKKPRLMNAEEFIAWRTEAYRAAGLDTDLDFLLTTSEKESYEAGREIDWIDEFSENAWQQDITLNMSGGNQKTSYYMSGTYTDQDGIVINSGYQRLTLKLNLDQEIKKWWKTGFSLLLSNSNTNDAIFGEHAIYALSPLGKLRNDDGTYTLYPMYPDNFYSNIIADNVLRKNEDKENRLFNNLFMLFDVPFIQGLNFRFNLGTDIGYNNTGEYIPRGTAEGELKSGIASVSKRKSFSWTLENIVNYSRHIGIRGQLDFTGLYSLQGYTYDYLSASAQGFTSDDYLWYKLDAGEIQNQTSTNYRDWNMVSYMGRINYQFDNRYYVTLTLRADGFSGFGKGNKWGQFPSVGFAWRLSNEPFLSGAANVDNLKIRLSYGQSGNQAVAPYQSLASLDNWGYVFGKQNRTSLFIASMPNENLSWETSTMLNAGIDYSFWNGRLSGTLEYYLTNTDDILLEREIPPMNSGLNSIMDNIGKTQNSGVEVEIHTVNINRGGFKWNTGLNYSMNRNKIIELYGDSKDDIGNEWFIGEPIDVYFTQIFDGVWQIDDDIANSTQPGASPGDAKLRDINGDLTINAEDRTIIGSPMPDYIASLSNTFTYKGFSLYVFIHSMQGHMGRVSIDRAGRFNQYYREYWTPENPINTNVGPDFQGSGRMYGSLDYYDASFIRLKDIRFSYSFPNRWIHAVSLKEAMIFINARDIYTFTNYPGDDPEVLSSYRYPVPRTFLLGINVKF
jgi:TonB-linked SusC/RagA family outer membrane protein